MMTQLITRQQLLERTPIGGNVDTDKIVPHIITSQDIELQTVLGTALYERILDDYESGSLTGDYATLHADYIVPMLAHYTASNFYLFHSYEIGNGGIYRHESENSFTPDLKDVRLLSEEQKNKGLHYRTRLNDYLCHNASLFIEYNAAQGAGMYPDSGQPSNQWLF